MARSFALGNSIDQRLRGEEIRATLRVRVEPMGRGKQEERVQRAIDEALQAIIDDWYENVSGFYVTQEQLEANPGLKKEEELKRFHDEHGHRIKFNKDDLDFTYGLRFRWQDEDFIIEVSVNNKVQNFDYQDFRDRLFAHYQKKRVEKVPTPYELRSRSYREIFQLQPNFDEAFVVEKREDKADIMRLSFLVRSEFLEKLVSHPLANKQLIEGYCVSPFRSVYAKVYRRGASTS